MVTSLEERSISRAVGTAVILILDAYPRHLRWPSYRTRAESPIKVYGAFPPSNLDKLLTACIVHAYSSAR